MDTRGLLELIIKVGGYIDGFLWPRAKNERIGIRVGALASSCSTREIVEVSRGICGRSWLAGNRLTQTVQVPSGSVRQLIWKISAESPNKRSNDCTRPESAKMPNSVWP